MTCRATLLTDVVVVVVALVLVVSVVSGAAFKRDYAISSITQSEGTRLTGSAEYDWMGLPVAGGGDVDGDGVDDFVVSADGAESLSGGASYAGHVYVLYGVTSASAAANAWPTGSTIKAIAQNSNRGRIIDGGASNTYLGQAVAIVGDVNGDGYDDIAIDSNGQGKMFLVGQEEG
jgi:hypothetical protein